LFSGQYNTGTVKNITLGNIFSSRIFYLELKEAKAVVGLEDTCLENILFGKSHLKY
jgi:hypothetical protein